MRGICCAVIIHFAEHVRSVLAYNWQNYQTSNLIHLHFIHYLYAIAGISSSGYASCMGCIPLCDSGPKPKPCHVITLALPKPFSSSFSTTNPTAPTPPFPQSSHNHHNGSRSKYNRYFTIAPSAPGTFGALAASSILGPSRVRRPTSRVNS